MEKNLQIDSLIYTSHKIQEEETHASISRFGNVLVLNREHMFLFALTKKLITLPGIRKKKKKTATGFSMLVLLQIFRRHTFYVTSKTLRRRQVGWPDPFGSSQSSGDGR